MYYETHKAELETAYPYVSGKTKTAGKCAYNAASATAVEGWIGGHSPRSDFKGDSDPFLRALLTPGAHPQSIPGLSILEG